MNLIKQLVASEFRKPIFYEDYILQDQQGRLAKFVAAYVPHSPMEAMFSSSFKLPLAILEHSEAAFHVGTQTFLKDKGDRAKGDVDWQRAAANKFANVPLARPVVNDQNRIIRMECQDNGFCIGKMG